MVALLFTKATKPILAALRMVLSGMIAGQRVRVLYSGPWKYGIARDARRGRRARSRASADVRPNQPRRADEGSSSPRGIMVPKEPRRHRRATRRPSAITQ